MLRQGGWGSRCLASLISLLSLCICCPQPKSSVKTITHSTGAKRAELTGRQRVAAEEALVAEGEGADVEVLRVGKADEGLLHSTVPLCPTPASKLGVTWQQEVMAGPERSWLQEQEGGGEEEDEEEEVMVGTRKVAGAYCREQRRLQAQDKEGSMLDA
jgi:hypothetical protein